MATHPEEEAPGNRFVLLTGLAVAGVASALAFGRVYQGHAITVRLVGAVLIATLLAAVVERRHVLLATAVSGFAMLVVIGLMIFPDTTKWALPTLATIRAIGTALRDVGREAALTVAPAPPVTALVLAGITASWTAAFASHSLAVRARSPFLAIAPPAALIAFAGMVVDDGARPGYVFLFLVGGLILLFADAIRRIGHWGPVTAWRGHRPLRPGSSATTHGAWRVAAGCLSVALFVPWLLPGYRAGAVLRVGGGVAQSVSLNPIVDIRPRLIQNPPIEVFTVRSTRPAYWRITSLDTFDGRTWTPSDPLALRGVQVGGPLPAVVPGAVSPTDTSTMRVTIRFGQHLAEPWLPMPYQAEAVSRISAGPLRYDPGASALVLPSLTYPGLTYDVTAQVVAPTPEELRASAPISDPLTNPYTKLPASTPAIIRQIAQAWTSGATSAYDKVMAIQTKLRGWQYDLKVHQPRDLNDLIYFLTVGHKGYCQQFAGSMAVLLRSIGIPARVAVGFIPSNYDAAAKLWRERSSDEHSWVEVFFPQYGWLAFEPTPTRVNPVASRYDSPPVIPLAGVAGRGGPLTRPGGFHDAPQPPIAGTHPGRPFVLPKPPPPGTDWARMGRFGALVLLGLVILGVPATKLARRRVVLARARDPGPRVLAAYRVTLERARDLGLGRSPGETVSEYRSRLTGAVAFSNGDFDDLSALTERAAYAGRALSSEDGGRAVQLTRRTSKDLRRSVPRWRAALGWFRLDRSYDRPVLS